MKAPHLPIPELQFDGATLRSASVGDVYFSAEGGLAETQYVFVANNHLPQRFHETPRFTIAETGFGSGLNFLAAWQAHAASRAASELIYISVEHAPLTPAQLARALAPFAELAPFAAQLLACYPIRIAGWHRINFGNVTLYLGFGEACALYQKLTASVDAWFLDGFAPAKNPAMWSEALLDEVARLSAPHATLATFTAAGEVKRQLQARGFVMEKVSGFGRKRDMLRGKFSPPTLHSSPSTLHSSPSTLVIGAGIAGASTAYALAQRGCEVTVLEAAEIAAGASGNPAGVLYPKLGKRWDVSVAQTFLAYAHMLRALPQWKEAGLDFTYDQPGMLKIPKDTADHEKLFHLNETLGLDASVAHWVEAPEASRLCGTALSCGGVWFPQGTWLSAPALCRAMLQHPRITLRTHTAVTALEPSVSGWCAHTAMGVFEAEHVVLACAYSAMQLLPHLALFRSAGQITQLPAASVRAPLRSILCHKGYVVPQENSYLIGATYDHEDLALEIRAAHHQKNLDELGHYLPNFCTPPETLQGRIAHRVTTRNKLPIYGKLHDEVGNFFPNMTGNLAHGSRGLLTAPYGAEKIADIITNSPIFTE